MSGTCKPDWAMIMSFAPKNGKDKKKKTVTCGACGKKKLEECFYRRGGNGLLETYACKVCKRKAARGQPRYGGRRVKDENAGACVFDVED